MSLSRINNPSDYTRQSSNFVSGADSDTFFPPNLCTQDSSLSANISYSGDEKFQLTALGLYFSYPESKDVNNALQKVYLSLYSSDPDGAFGVLTPDVSKPLFTAQVSEDLRPDYSRENLINTSWDSTEYKSYEVIFPTHGDSGNGVSLSHGSSFLAVIECRGLTDTDKLKIWERWSGPGQFIAMKARKDLSEKPVFNYLSDYRLGYSLFKEHPIPPSYKPVVLLREAGRSVGIWDNLVSELAYGNSSYVVRFDYDESQNMAALALKLQDEVTALSNLSFSDWGDGKVDLVGYGLGGLIAERYLRDHPDDHHVRRFVAVAVPFKGTPLLNWPTYTGTVPRLGSWLNKKFPNGSRDLLGAASGFSTGTTAVSQMADDNSYIKNKDVVALPDGVAVYSVSGNLPATYTQSLFHFTVARQENLGDLFIPGASAQPTWIPAANQKIIPEENGLNFTASLTKDSRGAKVEFLGPETTSLTYLHGKLLDVPAVRSAIKANLSGNN